MSASLTYVYGLIRADRQPSLRGVPRGMPGGGPVALLAVPGLEPRVTSAAASGRSTGRHWLLVSRVPEAAYGTSALERGLQRLEWVSQRALAHEAVIEHFLGSAAVLPMKLFTLFTTDERAGASVLVDRRRMTRILSRVAGQAEWGVRLTWDPAAAGRAVESRRRSPGMRPTRLTGAGYLARKRDLRDATRAHLQKGWAEAARVYRAAKAVATDARRRSEIEQAAPGSRVLLDAAFLVPAARTKVFRATVRRHAPALKRSGVAVALSGPWPAYNFI